MYLQGLGRRHRAGACLLGGLAVAAMMVVGCTKVVDGSTTVNTPEAGAYRTSASVSRAASASSSSSAASVAAVAAACQPFADGIDAVLTDVNAYVAAINNGNADAATTQAAVDALNRSADGVANTKTDRVPSDLKNALDYWVSAARGLASAIASNAATDSFNDQVGYLNKAKTSVTDQCKAN